MGNAPDVRGVGSTRTRTRWLVGGIVLALAAHADVALPDSRCDSPDNETRVRGNKECLVIRTFRPASPAEAPKLLVFLHGDLSDGGAADYIYDLARDAVADGRVVVALLRPGYFDSAGNQSSGDNGNRQDSYTKHNVDAIAAALKALREHHKASHLVVVGHSGGAAISGVILGRHPGVADAAVLAACPCFVAEWRAGRRRWTQSLSPDEVIKHVPVATRVLALTGDADDRTRPTLAADYVNALVKRGLPARFELVPGASHNEVVRRPELRAAIDELIAHLGR